MKKLTNFLNYRICDNGIININGLEYYCFEMYSTCTLSYNEYEYKKLSMIIVDIYNSICGQIQIIQSNGQTNMQIKNEFSNNYTGYFNEYCKFISSDNGFIIKKY